MDYLRKLLTFHGMVQTRVTLWRHAPRSWRGRSVGHKSLLDNEMTNNSLSWTRHPGCRESVTLKRSDLNHARKPDMSTTFVPDAPAAPTTHAKLARRATRSQRLFSPALLSAA